jgi:hypothetical protein
MSASGRRVLPMYKRARSLPCDYDEPCRQDEMIELETASSHGVIEQSLRNSEKWTHRATSLPYGQMKARLEDPLAIVVNSCWKVLTKYLRTDGLKPYNLHDSDSSSSSLRLRYFHDH